MTDGIKIELPQEFDEASAVPQGCIAPPGAGRLGGLFKIIERPILRSMSVTKARNR